MILRAASDLMRLGIGDLVQDHHVRELDLLDEEVHQRPVILLAERLAAVAQEIVAGIVAQQVHRIDHRHHRVEARHVRQALARLVAEVEGGGDRKRLGDAGRLDQQVVEAPLGGEPAHLLQTDRRAACSRCSRSTSPPASRRCATGRAIGPARDRRRCSPRTCRSRSPRRGGRRGCSGHGSGASSCRRPRKPESTVTGRRVSAAGMRTPLLHRAAGPVGLSTRVHV
jgi:hypothetical protein